jgi:hypothetical protein
MVMGRVKKSRASCGYEQGLPDRRWIVPGDHEDQVGELGWDPGRFDLWRHVRVGRKDIAGRPVRVPHHGIV